MADLFDSIGHEPLAARMRPRTLDEYIGQDHIVGKGRLLRRAIAADQLSSVIFYGPPGSGKTTLARVIANHTKSNFITLNAVLTGVADIRKAISEAEESRNLYQKKTILFVDEVHRWNKSQQDALLPWVENGTIILIGATTENPFFEVNKALVSRSRVFQLKGLTEEDLMNAARQALADSERGYGHWKVEFEEGALEHLVQTANGDARSLLNALELAVETTPEKWDPKASPAVPAWGSTIYISKETAEESIQKKVVLYDRDGDYHYDIISAFIKSLRGRDPDAACYWLARMVKAGEDPDFIFRRMLISACEDTGLADPNAIAVVNSCAQAFDRVGMPEGRFFLAHAALYLATAPKSNSSMAFFDALASVEKEDADVPNHLKDASRDAEGFGHGTGYLYPHAYRDHWVAQQYLPGPLMGKVFYTPTTQGYEAQIREDVLSRREVQISTLLSELEKPSNPEEGAAHRSATAKSCASPVLSSTEKVDQWWVSTGHFRGFEKTEENLTFTPKDAKKEQALNTAQKHWQSRLDSNKSQNLLDLRDAMIKDGQILRHTRVLIWNADDAMLIFEMCRLVPEGLCAGTCRNQNNLNILRQYASTLSDLDKPVLVQIPVSSENTIDNLVHTVHSSIKDAVFDRVFFKDIFANIQDIKKLASQLSIAFNGKEKTQRDVAYSEDDPLHKSILPILDSKARIVISQRIPSKGQKLSQLIKEQILPNIRKDDAVNEAIDIMEEADREFYSNQDNPLFAWDNSTVTQEFNHMGLTVEEHHIMFTEKRRITYDDINRWLNPSTSSYGQFLYKKMGKENLEIAGKLLSEACSKNTFDWKYENVIFTCELTK